MKKKLIIITSVILIIIFMSALFLHPKTKPKTASPTPYPSQEINPQASTTPGFNQLLKDSAQQTENDFKYGQALKDLHQKYPWYSQLPIETNEYRIIYDFDKNSFRIRLLTQSSESIKQAAIDKLKEIGVDLNKFSYYFLEP